MNKKNKGFTLIEVLATIAIIAVVTLIATIAYTRVRKNIISKEYKNLKSLIEIAGVKYASKTGYSDFYVEELIEEGYLEPDDNNNNIYDPRDEDHPLNCHLVHVSYDDNSNYKARLEDEEHKVNDGCDPTRKKSFANDLGLTVLITKTDINYINNANNGSKLTTKSDDIYKNINIMTVGGNKWTNKQLDITASLLHDSGFTPYYADIIGAKYIWNKNPDTTTIEPNRTHTTNVKEYYNDYYYLDVYTVDDHHFQSKFMYKYDEQKPVIYEEKTKYANPLDEFIWKKSKTILMYVTDKNGIGLDKIYAGTKPCEELKKDPNLGKVAVPSSQVQSYVVDDVEAGIDGENGEINLCAIDKLGNLADTKTFVVKKIDITPPHCTKDLKANRKNDVIGEHNKYQWESRTVRQYCFDNNMINGKLVVGSDCTKGRDYYSKTWSTTTKVGYITITDNVGWTTNCPVDVYVDRTAPVCNRATGNTQEHKNNNSATTLGVGSTDNWDQNFRHITQYCYDEHVGCKQNSWSKNWSWSESNPVIRTGTITIYDKVPKCSQKSITSSNCSNYDSIKDTAENLDNYNNSRTCTEGIYIDHVPPKVYQNANAFHGENRIKAYCTDTIDGVEGSGVASFEASASTKGKTNILPCTSGASNCASGNGPTISNTTGAGLQFKLIYNTHSISAANNVKVTGTCVDKAGNTDQDKELNFEANIASSIGNDYIGVTVDGCQLKEYRAKTAEECSHYSYDCSAKDTSCNGSNSGEKSTCCLQGADPAFGCKVIEENPSKYKNFGKLVAREKYNNDPRVQYMKYKDGDTVKYYFIPHIQSDEYMENCIDDNGVIKCSVGRECLVFNCYPDFPLVSAQEVRNYICGNYTR